MIGKRVLVLATVSLCAFLSGSCSKVVFEADPNAQQNGAATPGGGGGGLSDINCSVYFNSHISSVTVASAAANPDVHADCTPTNVNLNWTVRNLGGTAVTVNGLSGANSTAADFYSLGAGTYSVTVHATAPNYNDFTSNPITAVVQTAGPPAVTSIACTVQINGGTAPITVASGSPTNPHVTAACNPSAGSYVWTVTQGANTVTVPGLTGFDSTPSFPTMPPGVYQIYLHVSQSGYLPYDTTTPLQVTVSSPTTHVVTTTKNVTAQNNQLDILLVLDDSKSMYNDNQRLAGRLQGFVDNLTTAGFDWQMCTTVTNAQALTSGSSTLYWGASNFWSGNPGSPQYILKSGTSNLSTIFSNTITQIGAGWEGTDDERGIKAAYWHLYNGDPNVAGTSGCYRKDAGLAMIFISDEDERSIGGDPTQQYYVGEYKVLDTDDYPQTLINQVKSIFGTSKRFVANSIIVRPGDTACMAAQDAEDSKSHYGTKYAELSSLTGGYTASICASDYANSLEYFKNSIVTQMQSLTLDCTPVGSAPVVTVSPSIAYTYSLNGSSIVFSPAIPAGHTIQVQYNCPN